jgi:hypothetical protein
MISPEVSQVEFASRLREERLTCANSLRFEPDQELEFDRTNKVKVIKTAKVVPNRSTFGEMVDRLSRSGMSPNSKRRYRPVKETIPCQPEQPS